MVVADDRLRAFKRDGVRPIPLPSRSSRSVCTLSNPRSTPLPNNLARTTPRTPPPSPATQQQLLMVG